MQTCAYKHNPPNYNKICLLFFLILIMSQILSVAICGQVQLGAWSNTKLQTLLKQYDNLSDF